LECLLSITHVLDALSPDPRDSTHGVHGSEEDNLSPGQARLALLEGLLDRVKDTAAPMFQTGDEGARDAELRAYNGITKSLAQLLLIEDIGPVDNDYTTDATDVDTLLGDTDREHALHLIEIAFAYLLDVNLQVGAEITRGEVDLSTLKVGFPVMSPNHAFAQDTLSALLRCFLVHHMPKRALSCVLLAFSNIMGDHGYGVKAAIFHAPSEFGTGNFPPKEIPPTYACPSTMSHTTVACVMITATGVTRDGNQHYHHHRHYHQLYHHQHQHRQHQHYHHHQHYYHYS
jgi:hypothetical protein